MSEFELQRSDLAAMRRDVEGRMAAIEGRAGRPGLCLARVAVRRGDEKTDAAAICRAAPAVFPAMFATVAGTLAMLKAPLLLP